MQLPDLPPHRGIDWGTVLANYTSSLQQIRERHGPYRDLVIGSPGGMRVDTGIDFITPFGRDATGTPLPDPGAATGSSSQPSASQPINMNENNYDGYAKELVAQALQQLTQYLPRAFASPAVESPDFATILQPLKDEIASLHGQLQEMNGKYEEILYRLETEQLAAQA